MNVEQQKSDSKEFADIYRSLARHHAGLAEAYKQLSKLNQEKATQQIT